MAKDVRAGRAFIEMFLKQDRLQRDLRKTRMRLTRITGVIAGVGAAFTAVGVAAGTVAAAAILKATNAASDFAEVAAKFETVFGDRASPVRQWAEESATALNLTRKEALGALSGFQDLLVPLGIDSGAAENVSQDLLQKAADLAAFTPGVGFADALRDIQSALVGSSETMLKYGSVVKQAQVNQELLDQAMDPKTATEAEKVMARVAIIMRTTTAAQGAAAAATGRWEGKLKALGNQWQELQEEIGEKFLPLMEDLLDIGTSAFQQLGDAIKEAMPDFEGLDDSVLKLAQSGQWEKAGEIIGLQMKIGVRKALGPFLYDFLVTGVPTAGKGIAGAGAGALASLAPAGTAELGKLAARNLPALKQAGDSQRQSETMRMEKRLDRLIGLAQQELEEAQKNRKANESKKSGVFQ